MQGPLIFIATNRLKPGLLESERARVPGLVEFIEANEPRVIAFNEYVNEAGNEVTVVQVHPDAASMEAHIAICCRESPSSVCRDARRDGQDPSLRATERKDARGSEAAGRRGCRDRPSHRAPRELHSRL